MIGYNSEFWAFGSGGDRSDGRVELCEMELFCFSLQNKDEQCFDIFFVRSARLILCKQSYTRTFDRSYSWAIHSNFGPIKCRLKYIKILCKDCSKLSFDGVLKVLLLDKLYRREGCGKPLNRIFLQILCFQSRILWD